MPLVVEACENGSDEFDKDPSGVRRYGRLITGAVAVFVKVKRLLKELLGRRFPDPGFGRSEAECALIFSSLARETAERWAISGRST